jgi:putative transposase
MNCYAVARRKLSPVNATRFHADVIRHDVWLYFCFTLRLRDVEKLFAQRGIEVSCETIRCWTRKFGQVSRPT